MNILLFARAYEDMAGGIEKMSLMLAKILSERGHIVTIASLDRKEAKSFYPWPDGVRWHQIDIANPHEKATLRNRLNRLLTLRKVLSSLECDVAVGFQVGSFALLKLASLGLGIKTVAAERNAPTLFNFIRSGKRKRFFSNLILATSDVVAVQFEGYKRYYPRYLRKKLSITPNLVQQPKESRKLDQGHNEPLRLLCIGRLTFQKNMQLLLSSLSLINIPVHLKIVGDGPDLAKLKEMIESQDLNVEILPPVNDLSSYYLNADYYISTSRWEGFPNVIAESLSYGLPVIAFEQCAGMPQLIHEGVNGTLALGAMTAQNLAHSILRAKELHLDPKIIAESVSEYTDENFVRRWEEALKID